MAKHKKQTTVRSESVPAVSDPAPKEPSENRMKHILKNVRSKASAVMSDSDQTSDAGFSVPKFARRFRPKRREKICRAIAGNDIKYRGPLSYRYLRILAWLLCVLSVGGSTLSLTYKLVPNLLPIVGELGSRFSMLLNYALPLFMLANFAVILNAKNGYKKLLLTYAIFAALLSGGFLLVMDRYIIGSLEVLFDSRESAEFMFDNVLHMIFGKGFFAFNIFIDLFLCTALSFFLSYRPKHVFKGKLHFIFRLFAIFPILYEILSVLLKMLASMNIIVLPHTVWPLLTTKPPIVFIIFLAIAIYVKRRERRFRKSGFTLLEYQRYLRTNHNSWNFSLHVFLIFIVGTFIDFIAYMILPAILSVFFTSAPDLTITTDVYTAAMNVGFGRGLSLILLSPIVLLFSYTKRHKNPIVDKLIPVCGVALIIVFEIELIYQMIRMIPNL